MTFIPKYKESFQQLTYVFQDNNNEQTIFTIAPRESAQTSFELDLVNISRNLTLRIYCEIDGSNFRLVNELNLSRKVDAFNGPDIFETASRVQVTLQKRGAGLGGNRNIPYSYYLIG